VTEAPDIFPHIWMDRAAYAIADLRPPWAARIERTRRHWVYRVRRGECDFETLAGPPQAFRLETDDIVGVTNELPHAFRGSRSTPVPKAPRPFDFRPAGAPESDVPTSLLAGWVPTEVEPLISLFPSVFHVKADGSANSRRLLGILDLVELEIVPKEREAGSTSVLRRLSKLVVVELLRSEMRRVTVGEEPAWISGLADPLVSRVVANLHATPGERWTVEAMCKIAGLSRSALDERFHAVFGQPPKRYLLELRMRRAAVALAAARLSIPEIAASIGYESEAAFHRAFHRTVGVTPGVYRDAVLGRGGEVSGAAPEPERRRARPPRASVR
jgi:AraC-like DNA-binding protein